MSLFDLSTGDTAEAVTEFVAPTGLKQPMPEGTQLLCQTISAVWTEANQYGGANIAIELAVIQKGEFNNRIEKHTLKFGGTEKQRDTAAKALKVYDTLGKGIIAKAEAAGKDIDNNILSKALVNIEVLATFSIWEIEGNDGVTRSGNYVTKIQKKPAAVAAAQKAAEAEEDASILAKAAEMPDPDFDDDLEDEIPL